MEDISKIKSDEYTRLETLTDEQRRLLTLSTDPQKVLHHRYDENRDIEYFTIMSDISTMCVTIWEDEEGFIHFKYNDSY